MHLKPYLLGVLLVSLIVVFILNLKHSWPQYAFIYLFTFFPKRMNSTYNIDFPNSKVKFAA